MRYHHVIDFISSMDRVRLKVNTDDDRGLSSILSDDFRGCDLYGDEILLNLLLRNQ